MIVAGDELSHTQRGNNNTYCQDNELTWLRWALSQEEQAFLNFVQSMIQIRRGQPVFQRRKFFQGRSIFGADVDDITWFEPSGAEMTEQAWNSGWAQCFGVRLAGDLVAEIDERGEPITGDSILLLMNAHHEMIPFTLPARYEGQQWERLADTALPDTKTASFPAGEAYELQGRSVVVLRSQPPARGEQPAVAGMEARA